MAERYDRYIAFQSPLNPSERAQNQQNVGLTTYTPSLSSPQPSLAELTAPPLAAREKNAVTPCRWSPKPTVTHVNNVNNKDSFEQ